jgi:hypothetical protein
MECRERATPERVRYNPVRRAFERTTPAARTTLQKLMRETRRIWRYATNDGTSILNAQSDDNDNDALSGPNVDGFCIEIRGRQYCSSVPVFGQTVRRVLTVLSALDPSYDADSIALRSMYRPSHQIANERWHFEFMHEPITVTSFAPCYGEDSSRYSFTKLPTDPASPESDDVSSFILFQPESSFVWHDMGPGITRHQTNWEKPVTAREKIRYDD